MKDTRIEDLVKTILQATSVKEVIDADGERMSVGSNRLRLSVTDDVDIIIETDMGPMYRKYCREYWRILAEHEEAEKEARKKRKKIKPKYIEVD